MCKIEDMKRITEQFLLSRGWKRSEDRSEYEFINSKGFTIKLDGMETYIWDEYGFHDGMRYYGKTPTENEYFVLSALIGFSD